MSAPLILTLPMPPNLANSRTHWRVKHRQKMAYWSACELACFAAKVRPPREPMPRASISSVMYLGAAMDVDNAMARHKWTLDFLTNRRFIVDDRRSCLTWTGFPQQIVKRDGNYRLVLTLTPEATP